MHCHSTNTFKATGQGNAEKDKESTLHSGSSAVHSVVLHHHCWKLRGIRSSKGGEWTEEGDSLRRPMSADSETVLCLQPLSSDERHFGLGVQHCLQLHL